MTFQLHYFLFRQGMLGTRNHLPIMSGSILISLTSSLPLADKGGEHRHLCEERRGRVGNCGPSPQGPIHLCKPLIPWLHWVVSQSHPDFLRSLSHTLCLSEWCLSDLSFCFFQLLRSSLSYVKKAIRLISVYFKQKWLLISVIKTLPL